LTYADSSVIVKRYYEEPGTSRVREHFAAAERVFTSRLTYAEVHAALARKHRERAISEAMYRRAAAAFDADWPAYDQIVLDSVTLGVVPRLVRHYMLRGADAVHLGAAVWLREQLGDPVEFWVSDERLVDVARRERFTVTNPERGS
jgi:predicted nucleic acid-binding protein